jgi:hypothetical protein
MPRKFGLSFFTLLLAFTSITCAPIDESARRESPSAGRDGEDEIKPPAPLTGVPEHLRGRIDETLKSVRSRRLSKNNGFWTLFHGILGMGPDHAYLFDATDMAGKPIKALDYICQGHKVRGLEYRDTPDGVDVVIKAGTELQGVGQGHQDQFIAEMAEWGIPRDRVFVVDGKKRTFEDFIRYSKARVRVIRDPNQSLPLELSWAIIIVVEYFGTQIPAWTNLNKEEVSVEKMLRFELDEPIVECQVCGGTHRLFGLTWAYYRHRERGGKKEGIWLDVEKKIEEFKSLARKYQNKDGSFSTNYFRGPGKSRDTTLRLATTGHILEWLALALSDAELREPWIRDAANALCVLILENRDRGLDGGGLYHAAHGLELYRARVFGSGSHKLPFPLPPKS